MTIHEPRARQMDTKQKQVWIIIMIWYHLLRLSKLINDNIIIVATSVVDRRPNSRISTNFHSIPLCRRS